MTPTQIAQFRFDLIAPEIALCALALILMILDLTGIVKSAKALAYTAVIGLIAPALLLAGLVGRREAAFFDSFIVDDMASFFKFIFLIAAALVILSSVDFIHRRTRFPGEYYAIILFSTLGMMFMASGRELLTLYIGLELTSISLYILAAFLKRERLSSEAGLKYLLLGALSSTVLLYGMALLYGATGSTVLPAIASVLKPDALSIVALVLVSAGFGFKVAMVPFHLWAPDVYQGAPTPTTAFISVASKAAGFVVLLRVLAIAFAPLAGVWPLLFGVLAALTMTLGNVGALAQTNIKRLMGYSSIAQAGYALMAFSALTPGTASGLAFFILAYALTNLGVFAVITYVSDRAESDDLSAFEGLWYRQPLMALGLTACLLSLIGMPPLAGFWSKVYLFLSVFGQQQVLLVVIALINSAIAAFYYVKVIRAIYMRGEGSEETLAHPVLTPVAAEGEIGEDRVLVGASSRAAVYGGERKSETSSELPEIQAPGESDYSGDFESGREPGRSPFMVGPSFEVSLALGIAVAGILVIGILPQSFLDLANAAARSLFIP